MWRMVFTYGYVQGTSERIRRVLSEAGVGVAMRPDWEKSKILKMENNYSKRLISEAWFINAHSKVMNRSDGDSLPNVYRSLAK